ncbi:MAG: hypothetical protein HC799_00765 [Limnothrix sp. RL_2_0]|nr:hypothetical protein [Limnothrix sp. RL_2_0]
MSNPIDVRASFAQLYPNIAKFLAADGKIRMGYMYMLEAFVGAYDEGGTIYEGKSSYPSLDIALEDLDRGIKAYNDQWGIF